MSKDLQAIKYLNDTCINFLDRTKELYCTVTFTRKRAEILRDNIAEVEQALHRLESIDNANPSEALECLESIEADLTGLPKHVTEYDDGFDNYLEDIWNNIATIKQALLKAQEPKQYVDELKLVEKKLKALEIIKEKNVSIFQLSCCKNVNEYNDLKFKDSEKLTEEEFSLLKEMLGC